MQQMTREQAEQQALQLENASKILSAELEMSRARMTAFARKSENEGALFEMVARRILKLETADPERLRESEMINAYFRDHREHANAEMELMELGITKLESTIAMQNAMAAEIRKQLGASRLSVPGARV